MYHMLSLTWGLCLLSRMVASYYELRQYPNWVSEREYKESIFAGLNVSNFFFKCYQANHLSKFQSPIYISTSLNVNMLVTLTCIAKKRFCSVPTIINCQTLRFEVIISIYNQLNMTQLTVYPQNMICLVYKGLSHQQFYNDASNCSSYRLGKAMYGKSKYRSRKRR